MRGSGAYARPPRALPTSVRRDLPRATGADEPAVVVVAPAGRERPATQVAIAERLAARVPRDAVVELAPQSRCPDVIADDGAHRPPPSHDRQGRWGRWGRRRRCRGRWDPRLGVEPPSRRQRRRVALPREAVRREVRPPQRDGFCRRLRWLPPSTGLRTLPPGAALQPLPPGTGLQPLPPSPSVEPLPPGAGVQSLPPDAGFQPLPPSALLR